MLKIVANQTMGWMSMMNKLTEELLNDLLFTDSLASYLNNELEGDISLSEFLNRHLEEKQLKKSSVIRKSKLNTTFAYQLFSGDRSASKDKLLQLSFSMGLNLRETQQLLKIANAGELYCKKRRDAIIIYCVSKNMTLAETDDTLFQFQEATICEE